jgi:putative ABC transport system permease protein
LSAGAVVVHQFHVRLDHHTLPSDPAKAADEMTQRAIHYVTAVAGSALVGDNLGVALPAAREDALYARLLVLLLGIPALVLSAVVTALVISLRNDRQRRDLALLRLRGVTPQRATLLLGLVALADGLLGVALGLLGALGANRLALGSGAHLSPGWLLSGALSGLLLAVLIELAPLARLLHSGPATVHEQVSETVSARTPLPLRLGLDVLLLASSAAVFWLTSRGGYRVVVVPEGVPVASVNYAASWPRLWRGRAPPCWSGGSPRWPCDARPGSQPRTATQRCRTCVATSCADVATSSPAAPPVWPSRSA